ncbi:MAG: recombinase family protein [Cyanobacteria bacterium J06641_5]
MVSAHDIGVVAIEQNFNSAQLDRLSGAEVRGQLFRLLQEIQHLQRSRRLKQGHARNRLKAQPPPGKAPYGYRRGKERYILDRSTAPVVKDFFERFLLFGSLRGAVRYLEQKYGKKISPSTGKRWLSNPVYRGDLAYKDGDVLPDTHAAILTRDEAAQVDRLLRRNRRLPPRTASAPRSLAGLVTCAQCGEVLTVSRATSRRRSRSKEYLYLRSTVCPQQPKCKAIAYQAILEATIARICRDLPPAVARVAGAGGAGVAQAKTGLETEIAAREDIIAQLPTLQSEGILDADTADLRRYKLQTEISQLRDRLSQLPPENLGAIAQAITLPQFWLDLSEAERRFYFREFIREVRLARPDPKTWELELAFFF